MANKENIQSLIELMEKVADNEIKFDMQFWMIELQNPVEECGTLACIGGFCDIVMRQKELETQLSLEDLLKEFPISPNLELEDNVQDRLTKYDDQDRTVFLGITRGQGHQLFFPERWQSIGDRKITKDEAIQVLVNLRDTDEVVWPDP